VQHSAAAFRRGDQVMAYAAAWAGTAPPCSEHARPAAPDAATDCELSAAALPHGAAGGGWPGTQGAGPAAAVAAAAAAAAAAASSFHANASQPRARQCLPQHAHAHVPAPLAQWWNGLAASGAAAPTDGNTLVAGNGGWEPAPKPSFAGAHRSGGLPHGPAAERVWRAAAPSNFAPAGPASADSCANLPGSLPSWLF
jgi:hypothetical protein